MNAVRYDPCATDNLYIAIMKTKGEEMTERELIMTWYEAQTQTDRAILDECAADIVDSVKGKSPTSQMSKEMAIELLYRVGVVLNKKGKHTR